MDNLVDKIEAEFENIDQVLNELPYYEKLPYLSVLELAGVAALIHNFYNGIENILKQILKYEKNTLPDGKSWHKELLNNSQENKIISEETKIILIDYLAFRHFFSHAYALDLYANKMEPLVENCNNTYCLFKKDINEKLNILCK